MTMKCFYCGITTVNPKIIGPRKTQPLNMRTKDHVVPLSKGGRGGKVVACLGCNREKGSLSLDEYRAAIACRQGKVRIKGINIFASENYKPVSSFQLLKSVSTFFLIQAVLLLSHARTKWGIWS